MKSAKLLMGTLLLCTTALGLPQPKKEVTTAAPKRPAMVSPAHPSDSRGETVYEYRNESDQGSPTVSGTLLPPVLIKSKEPKYPKQYKHTLKEGHVILMGVVAEDGSMIDVQPEAGSDPVFAESALEAARDYHFRPATLEGKPVAFLLKIDVSFSADRH